MNKRSNGVYYTNGNPFSVKAFNEWALDANLSKKEILEPFAGANSLIKTLKAMGMCNKSKSFDINPTDNEVEKRDTLLDFPTEFSVCVTNPPWLAKNSATRRGLAFPSTHYDDLYKFALEKCLNNCKWVAALIPESYIRANLFQQRLCHFVSLTGKMFLDTDNPVGLALFQPKTVETVKIWRNNFFIGHLSELEKHRPKIEQFNTPVRFNDPNGNVGLIAIDNTTEQSIRFCESTELDGYPVRGTCRSITKLMVDGSIKIKEWNKWFNDFRIYTGDVLLTSFKGVRKDGMYRRRLDWDLARGIINHV